MATDSKRKKMPNMTYQEKSLMLDLVQHNINILENKRTDGVIA